MEHREQVPARYRQHGQTAALLDSLALSANEMAALVEEVRAQFFVDTATWSLPLWESQVGITAETGSSDAQRRAAIKARLIANGNTNEAMVSGIASAMTGYAAEVHPNDDYSFTLKFLGEETTLVQIDTDALAAAVETIKPAHLRFIISGLTWNALESVAMTWQQLEDLDMTWGAFENLTPVYGPENDEEGEDET